MKSKYDVGIVGLKCHDYLHRVAVPRYLGGIERQLVDLARALVQDGLSVCFFTYDHGGPAKEAVDGIDVYSTYRPHAGIPGIRFFYPRFLKLCSAIRRSDVGTIVQMGAGIETGTVAIGNRLKVTPSKFVFLVASNADCVRQNPFFRGRREHWLFRYGLRLADQVVSQTKWQEELLLENFGLSSLVRSLPLPDLRGSKAGSLRESTLAKSSSSQRVAWIGRISPEKRPDWVLDAADAHPNIQFDMIGSSNTDSGYSTAVLERAAKMANVNVRGKLGDYDLNLVYESASVLCCTSEIEGFPSTFLEAWSYEVPVLTSFDPDGIVEENQLGVVFATKQEMLHGLEQIMDGAQRDRYAENVAEFFESRYSAEVILSGIKQVFSPHLLEG